MLHIHHHLSSGVGAIGQIVANFSSGLGLTPPQKLKKKPVPAPGCTKGTRNSVDRRKPIKLQRLQNRSHMEVDNMNKVGYETRIT
jgi:hypothetical protein